MANLLQNIPYAINTGTGRRVRPEEASRHAKKGLYECFVPECKKHVFLAFSKYDRAYFKHYPHENPSSTTLIPHSKSQYIHTRAKELLRQVFANGLAKRAPMPRLVFETPLGIEKVLPFVTNCQVKNEFQMASIKKRIDLAIIDQNNTPVLLIEVNYKHPVDIEKEIALKPYWWIEVNAMDILKDPANLIVKKHRNLPYEYDLMGVQNILF